MKRRLAIAAFIFLFLSWSFFVFWLTPEGIVDKIGIHNGYLLAFVIALIGGTSILIPIPYYLVILTLGAAGLNPIGLGICAALGLMIGDSTSYFVGYGGHEVFKGRMKRFNSFLKKWSSSKHSWPLSIFLFIYGAIIPLPQDLVVVPLGFLRYGYWKTIIPVGLGSIIFNTLIAAAGYYGWQKLILKN